MDNKVRDDNNFRPDYNCLLLAGCLLPLVYICIVFQCFIKMLQLLFHYLNFSTNAILFNLVTLIVLFFYGRPKTSKLAEDANMGPKPAG